MTAGEEESRERLLFHLEHQTGFWFALVLGDDPRPRARFREMTEAWCGKHRRRFVLHEPQPEELVTLARELAKGGSPGIHWIRADGATALAESWTEGATQMFMAMNERREAYRQRLDGGILVEGRMALKRSLREMAPDMFSIRSFIIEPEGDPDAHGGGAPEWRLPFGLASFTGLLAEADDAVQQLERLKAFGGAEGTDDWVAAQYKAAVSLMSEGKCDEAEPHFRHLLAKSEQRAGGTCDNDEAMALLWIGNFGLGGVAAQRGDYASAISYFERAKTALSAYQPSDGEGGTTCVLLLWLVCKQLAGLYVAVGKLDVAHALLTNYSDALRGIPVHERTPDVWLEIIEAQRAMTYVLCRQGRYEEGEALVRETLQHAERRATESPHEMRWNVEIVANRTLLARILINKKDLDSAAKELRTNVALVEHLEASEPVTGALAEIAEDVYLFLANVLFDQRDLSSAAFPVQKRALRHLQQRYRRDPENINLGWLVVSQCFYGAMLMEAAGNGTGLKRALRQATALADRLPVQHEWQASIKRMIERVRPRSAPKPKGRVQSTKKSRATAKRGQKRSATKTRA